MLKTVVGLSEIGNYLRHLGSFLHRYAWASTSRSPSIGPFEASSLIFQELYLRTVSYEIGEDQKKQAGENDALLTEAALAEAEFAAQMWDGNSALEHFQLNPDHAW